MRAFRAIILLACLAGTMLATGCVAIPGGSAGAADGIVYTKGQLESYEAKPFAEVATAIRRMAGTGSFTDTSITLADGEFSLRAKDMDDGTTWISADRKGEAITRLRIRHSAMGGEAEARRLLDAIRANYAPAP
ncbi:MAG: DUF3568 family protein [Lentisphaeria bacterium]|jgi:hypothetical protein|nr:DUF3568 family protein [Lentisphaeria bacterium]